MKQKTSISCNPYKFEDLVKKARNEQLDVNTSRWFLLCMDNFIFDTGGENAYLADELEELKSIFFSKEEIEKFDMRIKDDEE